MAIVFGRLTHELFSDNKYHVYSLRIFGGDRSIAVYTGDNPPKVRKTVEYQLHGDWIKHPKYGKQIVIEKYSRSDVKQNMKIEKAHVKMQ